MLYVCALALVLGQAIDDGDGATPPPLLEVTGPTDGGRAPPLPALETEDGECVTDEGLPAVCSDEPEPEPTQPERRKKKRRRGTRRKKAQQEAALRGVGFVGATAGLAISNDVALDVGVTGAAGVLFKEGVGVVALAHVHLNPTAAGVSQRYGLGAGVRVGTRSHLTLGLTPTLFVTPDAVRFGGTVLAHIYAQLTPHVGLLVQPSLGFNGQSFVFAISGGAGFEF